MNSYCTVNMQATMSNNNGKNWVDKSKLVFHPAQSGLKSTKIRGGHNAIRQAIPYLDNSIKENI